MTGSSPSGWRTRFATLPPPRASRSIGGANAAHEQDFDKVAVNEHAAELKSEGILLTRFFALTHPSQPNYIASIGGDYFGLDHDDDVRVPENVSTVVDLLDVKGITWRGYFEDIPGPGYMAHSSDGSTGNGGWDYVRKHKFVLGRATWGRGGR